MKVEVGVAFVLIEVTYVVARTDQGFYTGYLNVSDYSE